MAADKMDVLLDTVQRMSAPGKGLLAADESTTTVGKRLASINLENTEHNRRALREFLFTSEGIENYISGVILFEETLFQTGSDGQPLVAQLTKRGIVPGIKADVGLWPLPGSPSETFTMGLDKLKERLDKYFAAGARFTKWRAVINIAGDGIPSEAAIRANAEGLAKYAAISQSAGLVPIVEPEVLSDGSHDLARCEAVTQRVLAAVFRELHVAGVVLEAMVLKPNMILPGSSAAKASPNEVAQATMRVLRRTVPPAVPSITFLSGGQSEEESTQHLGLMNQLPDARPWQLSFSYGRALQQSALKAWQGKPENTAAAQQAFLARAKANSDAALGKL